MAERRGQIPQQQQLQANRKEANESSFHIMVSVQWLPFDDNCEYSNYALLWAQKRILELGSIQQKIKKHLPTIQATATRIKAKLSGLASCIDQARQHISYMEDMLPPTSKGQKAIKSLTSELAQRGIR